MDIKPTLTPTRRRAGKIDKERGGPQDVRLSFRLGGVVLGPSSERPLNYSIYAMPNSPTNDRMLWLGRYDVAEDLVDDVKLRPAAVKIPHAAVKKRRRGHPFALGGLLGLGNDARLCQSGEGAASGRVLAQLDWVCRQSRHKRLQKLGYDSQ